MSKDTPKKAESIVDVQEVYTKTEMFLENNRKGLSVVLGALVLIFGGFFAFQYLYKNPKEVEASNAAIRADLYAEMDSLEWAVKGKDEFEGYEALAEKYGSTAVGKRANFWCGVYYRDKMVDYAAALEYFKKADFEDEALGIEAIGCVGDMYVMTDNLEEGAKWLEKAAQKANRSASRDFTGPIYGLKAAKVYMELNKNDKAVSLLQYIVDNFDKKSQEYNESEKLLAYLNAME